jgi:hypothetical protein
LTIFTALLFKSKDDTDGRRTYLVSDQQDMPDRPSDGIPDPFTGELMF